MYHHHQYVLAFFFILLFSGSGAVLAQQDRTSLENEKKKLEKEIEYSNHLLEQTQQTRQASLGELAVIKSKIGKREALITTIQSEIALLNRQITATGDSINELNEDLKSLKEEYAKMIYYAYKNMNVYDRLMFIFSAEDLNQAYQRMKYFQYYNRYREQQAELIREKTSALQAKNNELEDRKKEKQALLDDLENEKAQLSKEQADKDNTVQNLTRKEKELRKTIKEKEKAAEKLQKAIEDIIAEEIRLAAERASKTGTEISTSGMFPLTPEEVALSKNFAGNKGKLPWPLTQGIISERFGQQPHPVLRNVKIMNNGIDILTSPDTQVRSVFDGTVTRVINVPNNNNVVMIRHGEYLTVYSNLDKVYVHKGDPVTTGQEIGSVFTSPVDSRTELHFEVWQSKTLLNPEDWILKR